MANLAQAGPLTGFYVFENFEYEGIRMKLRKGVPPKTVRIATVFGLLTMFFATAAATDGLYYYELTARLDDKKAHITGEVKMLASFDQLNDPEMPFKGFMVNNFDAPIQSAIALLETMDQQREVLFKKRAVVLAAGPASAPPVVYAESDMIFASAPPIQMGAGPKRETTDSDADKLAAAFAVMEIILR